MVADRHTVPSRSPEVDDERVVVFFDGTDAVWGGCTDFEERYLRLERDTGDQSVSQSVSHYHTPTTEHMAHTHVNPGDTLCQGTCTKDTSDVGYAARLYDPADLQVYLPKRPISRLHATL